VKTDDRTWPGYQAEVLMEQRARTVDPAAAVERVRVMAYEVPVDGPEGRESDGTLEWDSTTCIVVLASAAGRTGVGYTYGDIAVARLIDSHLTGLALGSDALTPAATWHSMFAQLRNAGRPGAGAMAVSAVDIALWDLRARLLGHPLFQTVPAFHDQVPVYGSGGFTNYPLGRLAGQLAGWVEQGIPRVKMKTARHPGDDPARLTAAREAIGDEPKLFTDANGAYSRKEALAWAYRFRDEFGVSWLEEPVSSEDVDGLALLRAAGPPGLDIAAGEYGFLLSDFGRLLDAGAVDCLQADVTRCGGITGLLQVAGLAAARQTDLSAHCAPAVSAHAFCAVERLRHLEYFHDHVRVEAMLFDGVRPPVAGALRPDPSAPGLGLELRTADATGFQVYGSDHSCRR
jgi:L-alanine-DL-glutamate epimerase-like enolase superfamily enzyme